MFGIGAGELLVLMALALIVVGPQKLPEIARTVGGVMNKFKTETEELRSALTLDTRPQTSPTTYFPGAPQTYGSAVERMTARSAEAINEAPNLGLETGERGGADLAGEPLPAQQLSATRDKDVYAVTG
jgi:Tat protein translocase TatB subunit